MLDLFLTKNQDDSFFLIQISHKQGKNFPGKWHMLSINLEEFLFGIFCSTGGTNYLNIFGESFFSLFVRPVLIKWITQLYIEVFICVLVLS